MKLYQRGVLSFRFKTLNGSPDLIGLKPGAKMPKDEVSVALNGSPDLIGLKQNILDTL